VIKPQRFFRERLGEAADEASAFLRRRRVAQQPYARVYYPDGTSETFPPEREEGRQLFLAAADLIELARQ
jgi:hypothetical protein